MRLLPAQRRFAIRDCSMMPLPPAQHSLRRYAVDSVEHLRALAARLCRTHSSFSGWVGVDTSLRFVGELRAGNSVRIAADRKVYEPALRVVERNGLDSFEFEAPASVSGRITVFTPGDLPLLGSDFAWPPDFGLFGWVIAENEKLVGKARLDWAPALPIALAIGPCGEEPIRLPAGSAAGDSTGSLFSIPLDGLAEGASRLEVSAVLPDGRCSPLAGSPVGIQPITPTPVGVKSKRAILVGAGSGQIETNCRYRRSGLRGI